jgi:hypothetical protein
MLFHGTLKRESPHSAILFKLVKNVGHIRNLNTADTEPWALCFHSKLDLKAHKQQQQAIVTLT